MVEHRRLVEMHCIRSRRTRPSSWSAGLAAAFMMMLVACSMTTQVRRDAQFRRELDAARINQPLAGVWPVVLHLLADHGYQLVGGDRLVVGAPPAARYKRLTAGGFETGKTDHGLVLETMTDASGVRYRAEGRDLDGKACQVRFTAIRLTGSSPSEERSRNLDLELELVRRLDPEQAKRIVHVADAVK